MLGDQTRVVLPRAPTRGHLIGKRDRDLYRRIAQPVENILTWFLDEYVKQLPGCHRSKDKRLQLTPFRLAVEQPDNAAVRSDQIQFDCR
jgi:hypothetical protein